MSDNRRLLHELVQRYQRERGLTDVYVEGRSDRLLFEWFYRTAGIEAKVYEIDTVSIDAAVGGNRGRLIALAEALAACEPVGGSIKGVACIVDKDFNGLVRPVVSSPLVVRTDFASIECYAFDAYHFEKFASLVLRTPMSAETWLPQFESVLREVFLIRATNELLGWNMSWMPFERLCTYGPTSMAFDSGEFIRRYLKKNSRARQLTEFIANVDALSLKTGNDPRNHIRGHDYTSLLYALVCDRLGARNPFSSAEGLERGLLGTLEFNNLSRMPLFQHLLERASESLSDP